jgi:hypothetical protein
MPVKTFDKTPPRAVAQVGNIIVTLKDRPAQADQPAGQSVTYSIQLLAADGSPLATSQGNLEPYLSAAQLTGLQSLLTTLRTKAGAELL